MVLLVLLFSMDGERFNVFDGNSKNRGTTADGRESK